MNKNTYYLGIRQPNLVRRELLEAAKLSVAILRSKYRIRDLRERKVVALKELQSIMGEMNLLMEKLHKDLPNHSRGGMPEIAKQAEARIREEKEKKLAKKKKAKKKAAKKKIKKKVEKIRKKTIKKTVKKTVAKRKKAAKKAPKKLAKKAAKKTAKKSSKPASELNKLENKLADIESKLRNL